MLHQLLMLEVFSVSDGLCSSPVPLVQASGMRSSGISSVGVQV